MQIFVFNRKNEKWNVTGAVAIVSESQAAAEALYRKEFEFEFEFEVKPLAITEGLMLVADGYDSTKMVVCHLTPHAADCDCGNTHPSESIGARCEECEGVIR